MLLDKLALWIHSVSFDSLPSAAIEKVKECITDVYGVALSGSLHASTKMLRKALLQSYGEGQCSVIGCNERIRAESAAAANAFAAHVLDFDDTCYAGIVHPSAVLFPTIM